MTEHGGDIYRNKVDIDFSVNVSPYGIPSMVQAALSEAWLHLNQYPDESYEKLKEAIGRLEDVAPNKIVCGNGASELIYVIARAMVEKGYKGVGLLEPGFSEYKKAALAAGVTDFNQVKLLEEKDFMADISDLKRLFSNKSLVMLGHPNNPTGRLLPQEWIEAAKQMAEETDSFILLDESFIDLATEDKSRNIEPTRQVVIVKSFTKSMSIPGLRLGYAIIEDDDIRDRVIKLLPEWNVSIPAMYAGIACTKCVDEVRRHLMDEKTGLASERKYLANELKKLGIKVFDSDCNFLLIKSGRNLYHHLLQQGILIRSCENFEGLTSDFYRVAVKSHQENIRLIEALSSEAHSSTAKSSSIELMHVQPEDIEAESFSIISEELNKKGILLEAEKAPVIKRCIHTTADFEYAYTLQFSENAVSKVKALIREGAHIITDTNMALTGINKRELEKYGGQVHCFMADPDIAAIAKERGITRATASMEHGAQLPGKKIFVVGNAPTALIALCNLMDTTDFRPDFVIGVPVGFVNVEQAKEMIMKRDLSYIVNRGRKGGSNVAAAICNAILYELRKE